MAKKRTNKYRPSRRKSLRGFGQLEPRLVLAANPIITEFMASNGSTLDDEDGDSSDWLEIFNDGDESLDLAGWRLTDDRTDLAKWTFPSIDLEPGDYLVVFASDKDRNVSSSELHTNFKLSKSGEYLGLVRPNGTIASEYAPEFVAQQTDVSYGLAQQSAPETLVFDDTPLRYVVPQDGSLEARWTEPNFDDSGWILSEGITGQADGLGYEDSPSHYAPFLDTLIPSPAVTVYARYEFDVPDVNSIDRLTFSAMYDDGFVAYLNGTRIASDHAPSSLDFDSSATAQRGDLEVIEDYVEFDVTDHRDLLMADGNVLAVHALNQPGSSDMLFIPRLFGLNSSVDLDQPGFLSQPSPGATNSDSFTGFVEDVSFSVERGVFANAFHVEIANTTPEATIVYTTDGSVPAVDENTMPVNGNLYTEPIPISQTSVLRAAAFKSDFEPSAIGTHTYLFPADIADQDYNFTRGRGFPGSWGGTAPDYGVNVDPADRQAFEDGLTAIPTISISIDQSELFDADNGIYTNSTRSGRSWEREASVEYLTVDGTEGFQEDAGLRLQGGAFRNHSLSKKHSLRLVFRREYGGTGELEYDLFGNGAVQSFDTVTLRMDANDGWAWNSAGAKAQYARDEFGRRTQLAMGQPSSHGSRAHVYLNGVFWGLYNPVERPDANFAASYYGGDADNWDAINSGDATDGTTEAWDTLVALSQVVASAPREEERTAAFLHLQGLNPDGSNNPLAENYLDVENYIDYLLVNFYGGNSDWPFKNYYAARERGLNSTGFKFHMWDSEWSLRLRSSASTNRLGDFRGVAEPYGNLLRSLEFQTQFGDQVHRALFHDGPLTTERTVHRYQEILQEIDSAINSEAGRWGDQHRTPGYDRDDWLGEQTNVIDSFLNWRADIFLSHLRPAKLYPLIEAVSWNQRGGTVEPDFDISLSAPDGTIYYTVNGPDPRDVGGGINVQAIEYTGPMQLDSDATIRARVLHDGSWSAVDVVSFDSSQPSLVEQFLRISEIHYHPADASESELQAGFTQSSQFEFVELLNISTNQTIDLQGVAFTDGIDAVFSQPAQLPPSARALVVSDLAAFTARYGTSAVNNVSAIVEFETGQLSNDGEQLTLSGPAGEEILDFRYNDGDPWTPIADGVGSLQLWDEVGTSPNLLDKYYAWRGSYRPGGTPGTASDTQSPQVVINELLTNADAPLQEAIELYNAGSVPVDIGGWHLSDDSSDFAKFAVPDGTILTPGEFVVFDERDFNPSASGAGLDFALSAEGEQLWLTRSEGSATFIVDMVEFGAAEEAQSLGRVPDGVGRLTTLAARTIGEPNAPAAVGSVVITEVHFHPNDPRPDDLEVDPSLTENELEFVELSNLSATTVNLAGWHIDGEVDYEFEDLVLEAGESIVLVPFSPTNEIRTAAFENHYGISALPLAGPYDGQLSNSFGRVSLSRPGTGSTGASTVLISVDELVYDDLPPWPRGADGNGGSLQRIASHLRGTKATSWAGVLPTPGNSAFLIETPPRVIANIRDEGLHQRPDLLNRITVRFNQSVTINSSALHAVSSDGSDVQVSVSEFRYDDANFVAEWIVGAELPAGIYSFRLFSSEVRGLDGSLLDGNGDGQAGGDLNWDLYVAIPGDANLDFNVDLSDFGAWNNVKFCANCRTDWAMGDFNADGVNDVSDFNVWNENKFTSVATLRPINVVSYPLIVSETYSGHCSHRMRILFEKDSDEEYRFDDSVRMHDGWDAR